MNISFIKYNPRILAFVASIILLIVIASCARMGSPVGGPKDIDAPRPIKSAPINYSTNYKGKKIIIGFDEYVVLKNINQELLINPLLEEKPTIKLRGKNIIIKFNEELKDSSTYNINFYNAITDLNEGNLLKNFIFEFSTGEGFDSLYMAGIIRDAFNYQTESAIYVMLYENMYDSIPRTTLPNYISKCDEEGYFSITNIGDKGYYIFALKDMNNNMLFDLPNECIAFTDSIYKPSYKFEEMVDTFKVVSMVSKNKQDTLWRDSIHTHMEWVTTISDIDLLFFEEENKRQYLNSTERITDRQVYFTFNKEVTDNFSVVPITPLNYSGDWYIQEILPKRDSIVYWLTDSLFYKKDTVLLEINYTMKDSVDRYYTQKDTVLFYFEVENISSNKEKKDKNKVKKEGKASKLLGDIFENTDKDKEVEEVKKSELIITGLSSNGLDLNRNLGIETNYPIRDIDISLFELVKIEMDTIETPVEFIFMTDSLNLRRYNLQFEKYEADKFKLVIYPGAMVDVYNNINDTVEFVYATKTLNDYSILKLDIKNISEYSVFQMLKDDEAVIAEYSLNAGDTSLSLEYLNPGKIKLKLFYDINKNGKWDTGNFAERKQPEKVFYFPITIELIKGIDYEYSWDIEEY